MEGCTECDAWSLERCGAARNADVLPARRRADRGSAAFHRASAGGRPADEVGKGNRAVLARTDSAPSYAWSE